MLGPHLGVTAQFAGKRSSRPLGLRDSRRQWHAGLLRPRLVLRRGNCRIILDVADIRLQGVRSDSRQRENLLSTTFIMPQRSQQMRRLDAFRLTGQRLASREVKHASGSSGLRTSIHRAGTVGNCATVRREQQRLTSIRNPGDSRSPAAATNQPATPPPQRQSSHPFDPTLFPTRCRADQSAAANRRRPPLPPRRLPPHCRDASIVDHPAGACFSCSPARRCPQSSTATTGGEPRQRPGHPTTALSPVHPGPHGPRLTSVDHPQRRLPRLLPEQSVARFSHGDSNPERRTPNPEHRSPPLFRNAYRHELSPPGR